MVKKSVIVRRCAQCGLSGHNFKTCSKKNDNNNTTIAIANSNNYNTTNDHDLNKSVSIENRCSKNVENEVEIDAERKKGRRWTEQEHRLFLTGLKELRKVDWIGISRRFVKTRSPSQVASHAQKYYLRQTAIDKKKTSVFDLSLNEAVIFLSLIMLSVTKNEVILLVWFVD
ncbi:transcription factor KUA1-like [Quercus suber]|uniref:transcription factor KUA1-like n=1 Tax=Quercus suber TaxID=58331 RepID=UPI0032E029A4